MTAVDGSAAGVTAAAVAGIWAELGLPVASHDDDFFELGGDSLTLVRFLARVQDTWGLELPVDTIFDTAFTAVVAAGLIEREQLAVGDEEEIAAALAELEGMSDEEVQALLAGEDAAGPAAGGSGSNI